MGDLIDLSRLTSLTENDQKVVEEFISSYLSGRIQSFVIIYTEGKINEAPDVVKLFSEANDFYTTLGILEETKKDLMDLYE